MELFNYYNFPYQTHDELIGVHKFREIDDIYESPILLEMMSQFFSYNILEETGLNIVEFLQLSPHSVNILLKTVKQTLDMKNKIKKEEMDEISSKLKNING